MSDLSVTAGSVAPVSGATIDYTRKAGATLTAGQLVYLDTADVNKAKLADADAVATALCHGITLNGASSGQPVAILTSGGVNPGATVVVGGRYHVSATAGGITADAVASGDFPTIVGIGTTSSNIKFAIIVGGVAVP